MIFGITVKEGTIKIGDTVYVDLGMTDQLGKIQGIQKDKVDIIEATSGQEVCVKLNTKKVMDRDVQVDTPLYC